MLPGKPLVPLNRAASARAVAGPRALGRSHRRTPPLPEIGAI